jgi:hypothetical protein
MTTLEAIFDGKVLLLEEPLQLAPNTRVRITIEPVEPEDAPSSFLRTARGLKLDAPADFATNIEEHLYGAEHDAST